MASQSRTIKVKFDGDAKDLAKATKAAEKAVGDFGDKGGRKFTSSFRKWMSTGGLKEMRDSGKFGASVFGSGLLGALKTPVIGPAIAAVLTAAVATALPAVGAVAAGGLVAGFGAGLAGLGLVFAAKNEEVKKVWEDTLGDLGRDMQLLARPFEDTLIHIAGFFRRTVDAFNPHLAKAFAKMAGPIEDFVDDAANAFEKLIPAIDPITDAFNEVLGTLGPALEGAIDNISQGMVDLANSVAKSPEALADMVEGMGSLTREALGLVTALNDVNAKFTEMTGGVSLVNVVFKVLEFAIGAVAGPFKALSNALSGVNALLGRTGKDVEGAGASMSDAAAKTVGLANAQGNLGTQAQHAAAPVKTLAEKTKDAAAAAAEAKRKFEEWLTKLFALQNLALGLSGAQINLKDAIDSATASVKENGRTLDLNTEKGRANRTALNSVASAANAQTEAMIRSGKGSAAAAANAETSRTNFVTLARQMGLSKKDAEALARQLIAIPNVSREAKLTADKKDLDDKLAAARQALKDPDLTKERRAKLDADISQLTAQLNAAQRQINALKGKTVTIRMVTVGGTKQDQGQGGGGRTPTERRAHGGPVFSGRSYLVGENGPEVLTVGSHGQGHITPNHQLGGDTHVYVTIDGQQLQGRIDRTVRDRDRGMKRALGAGALRGAPA